MRRREFVTVLGGAVVAWPLAARAQQPAMTRVGITTIQPRTSPIYAAFDERLRELGYTEGQNLVVDLLNPQNQAEALPEQSQSCCAAKSISSLRPTRAP
jgi:putative ABC transport system substrate-binding protein